MLDDELAAAAATDRMVTGGGQPITAVLTRLARSFNITREWNQTLLPLE